MDTKILLIDDDARIVETFARMLKLAGYTLFTAADGKSGLALYHRRTPDIILLDLRMPGMDGLEVLRAMRAHDPEVNVILCTGHSDHNDAITALRAGAADLLPKPVSQPELESALRRAEERIQLKRKLRASEEALRQQNEQLETAVKARTAELEREIEEHRLAEKKISLQSRHMQLAQEMARLGYWSFDIETGTSTWSDMMFQILGCDPADGVPDYDEHRRFIHPDDWELFDRAVQNANSGTPYDVEFRVVFPDGSIHYVNARGYPQKDTEGQITTLFGTTQDITKRKQVEETLLASEEYVKRLNDALADVIFTVRLPEREIEYVNKSVEQVFGYCAEECIGQRTQRFYPGEDEYREFGQVLERAIKHGAEIVRAEQVLARKNGECFLAEITTTFLQDESGITKVISIIRDITERKRIEKSMQESKALLRQVIDLVPYPIFAKDDEGRFILVNHAGAEFGGLTIDQMVGHLEEEWVTDDDVLRKIRADDRRVIESGELQFFPKDTFVNAQGEECVMQTAKIPFYYQEGKPPGVLGISIDITERVQAEEMHQHLAAQVHQQAQQMEQILATVPEGVLLLDAAGHVMLTNPVTERALSFLADWDTSSPDRPITHLGGCPLTELLTSPPTKGLWHEVEQEGQTFEIIARPIENGPEPEEWVLLLRDVTQEREVQRHIQHQEQLAAVGQLAAGIAHDFNNIIAVIVLYTEMVLNAPDVSSTHRKRLETVAQQAKQAATLIEQILDFSRRTVLERRPMDLTPFLKEVIKLLERTVPENVEIGLSYSADEYTVSADPTRMQQVILNLVVNARDAMPEGGELNIALSRAEATDDIRCVSCGRVLEGKWVRIAVTDTGSGIPPEALPHIFEPFFTTKEVGQGAGLGLPQVYGIVKQHEGHIDVTTQLGQGTTVTIYLPALLAHQPVLPSVRPHSVIEGRRETILVVEDNATLRAALVESIAALNYRILEAANGYEALEILEQRAGEISLVLSDLVMPKMGGQALFHAMKERGLDLPVVMLSGHPMKEELEGLKAQGLAGWMLKPPDMEKLSQLLAQALEETVKL